MRRKAASTVRATASGSVFSASVVKPTTSAKSTVASFRSPAEGAARVGAPTSPLTGVPQLPQKRCPAGLAKPHEGHPGAPSAVPQDPQNLNPAGLSAPQLPHSAMDSFLPSAAAVSDGRLLQGHEIAPVLAVRPLDGLARLPPGAVQLAVQALQLVLELHHRLHTCQVQPGACEVLDAPQPLDVALAVAPAPTARPR